MAALHLIGAEHCDAVGQLGKQLVTKIAVNGDVLNAVIGMGGKSSQQGSSNESVFEHLDLLK